jgi:hypothetical protein
VSVRRTPRHGRVHWHIAADIHWKKEAAATERTSPALHVRAWDKTGKSLLLQNIVPDDVVEYEFHQQMMTEAAAALVLQQKENLWQLADAQAVEKYSGEGYTERNAACLRSPSERMTDAIQLRLKARGLVQGLFVPPYGLARERGMPDPDWRRVSRFGFYEHRAIARKTAFFSR